MYNYRNEAIATMVIFDIIPEDKHTMLSGGKRDARCLLSINWCL